MILIPAPASFRYLPDFMELEGAASLFAGTARLRFSDAQGRVREGTAFRELKAASGVIVVEAGHAKLVASDALFAVAGAACPCGADATVDIHELYKRTHGGPGPARLLGAVGLGRGLRGRCGCGTWLGRTNVRSSLEAPFAHFAVIVREAGDLLEALSRATGPRYRTV